MERIRQPVRIFAVYAPEDEELWQKLERHLASLQRENIADWEGQRLLGGDSLDLQEQAFNNARLILLLISADFLASRPCMEYMQQALERQSSRVKVIPIVLRAVQWQTAESMRLRVVLPSNKRAVTLWGDQDEAWESVVADLQRVIEGTLPRSPKLVMSLVSIGVLLLLLFGFLGGFLYLHGNSPSPGPIPQVTCSGAKQGVTLYTRPNYMGKCYTFDIGDHDLASVGLDQAVESLRDPQAAYMVRLRDQNGRPGVFDKDMPLLTDDWIDKAHTVHVEAHRPLSRATSVGSATSTTMR